MLENTFRWPVDSRSPQLGNCPVVLIGHALKNDFSALSRALGVHTAVFENVVSTIDTQEFAARQAPGAAATKPVFLAWSA